jgi:dipeptidyl aminopeptidase/acylaminoacyl peptidase
LYEQLTTSEGPDGTFMGYVVDPLTFRDIWIRRPGGTMEMVLKTPANERVPILSPDGRLFVYLSNESGADRLYLRDVEALERRWQVSTDGGDSPVWSRDGSRLYFLRGESIYFVTVRTEGGVRVGEETLFVTVPGIDRDDWGNQTFDSMPDGGLLVSVAAWSEVVLRVVLGWRGQL